MVLLNRLAGSSDWNDLIDLLLHMAGLYSEGEMGPLDGNVESSNSKKPESPRDDPVLFMSISSYKCNEDMELEIDNEFVLRGVGLNFVNAESSDCVSDEDSSNDTLSMAIVTGVFSSVACEWFLPCTAGLDATL